MLTPVSAVGKPYDAAAGQGQLIDRTGRNDFGQPPQRVGQRGVVVAPDRRRLSSGSTSSVRTLAALNPRSTDTSFAKLRRIRPAPVMSTSASATSTPMSHCPARFDNGAPLRPPTASIVLIILGARESLSAGTRPKSRAVSDGEAEREREHGRVDLDR